MIRREAHGTPDFQKVQNSSELKLIHHISETSAGRAEFRAAMPQHGVLGLYMEPAKRYNRLGNLLAKFLLENGLIWARKAGKDRSGEDCSQFESFGILSQADKQAPFHADVILLLAFWKLGASKMLLVVSNL